MKIKLSALFGFSILIGFIFQGVFGVAGAVLLSAIVSIVVGVYKKDRAIWVPSLIVLAADIIAILTFISLLVHSNM